METQCTPPEKQPNKGKKGKASEQEPLWTVLLLNADLLSSLESSYEFWYEFMAELQT